MANSSEEIISIRRDSIVTKITQEDGKCQICKCYQPENHPQYQKVFGADNSFQIQSHPKDNRKYLYYKEASLLRALSELEEMIVPIVPQLEDEDKSSLKMYLEYLTYPTYQSRFMEKPHDEEQKRRLTGEITQILVGVHNHCQQHLAYLESAVNRGGKKRLKKRSPQEEIERWKNYLQVIVYHCSGDMENYWQKKNLDPENLKPKTIRKHIRKFLQEKDIDLDSRVQTFISQSRQIIPNQDSKSFVHGDFSPQNIFYTEDKDKIRVVDFDKARLDAWDVDLISALYNIYAYPFSKERELFSSEVVKQYLLGIHSEANLQDVLARLVASRLKENIRLFAVYCQMNDYETRKLGDLPHFSNLENGEFRSAFLDDTFKNHFKNFFDYYRYREGEGWEVVVEPSSGMKDLVRKQLSLIEDFLKEVGVIRGVITSERGRRWKRILTPP